MDATIPVPMAMWAASVIAYVPDQVVETPGRAWNVSNDIVWMRTREGVTSLKAKRRLKGKPPKLSKTQRMHILRRGTTTASSAQAELAELLRTSPGRRCMASSNEAPPEDQYGSQIPRTSWRTWWEKDYYDVPCRQAVMSQAPHWQGES